jgi:hypothetical protein
MYPVLVCLLCIQSLVTCRESSSGTFLYSISSHGFPATFLVQTSLSYSIYCTGLVHSLSPPLEIEPMLRTQNRYLNFNAYIQPWYPRCVTNPDILPACLIQRLGLCIQSYSSIPVVYPFLILYCVSSPDFLAVYLFLVSLLYIQAGVPSLSSPCNGTHAVYPTGIFNMYAYIQPWSSCCVTSPEIPLVCLLLISVLCIQS